MDRQFYIDLANRGVVMPIIPDLVLHEQANPQAVLLDGAQLGAVLEEAARRVNSPLAFPYMDLELEKHLLLEMIGVPAREMHTFHFAGEIAQDVLDRFARHRYDTLTPRLQAHVDSVRYIAGQADLVAVGMVIGPFSLMTKLVSDPITPIALAGMGITAEEDAEVAMVEKALELAVQVILRSAAEQVKAGAKAIFIAEPAANRVYLSPNQIEAGSDIFDRYVMAPNGRIKAFLAAHDVDLILHDCGELTDDMVAKLAELDPAILSLGSSRKLWEDAALVPKHVVLFGNLASKKFYSDAVMTVEEVEVQSRELIRNMKAAGHPFILGSECDILSVPGSEDPIHRKVTAMLNCCLSLIPA